LSSSPPWQSVLTRRAGGELGPPTAKTAGARQKPRKRTTIPSANLAQTQPPPSEIPSHFLDITRQTPENRVKALDSYLEKCEQMIRVRTEAIAQNPSLRSAAIQLNRQDIDDIEHLRKKLKESQLHESTLKGKEPEHKIEEVWTRIWETLKKINMVFKNECQVLNKAAASRTGPSSTPSGSQVTSGEPKKSKKGRNNLQDPME